MLGNDKMYLVYATTETLDLACKIVAEDELEAAEIWAYKRYYNGDCDFAIEDCTCVVMLDGEELGKFRVATEFEPSFYAVELLGATNE